MNYAMIFINWTSPFPILRMSGVFFLLLFHFWLNVLYAYSASDLRRLIWVYTVCLGPKKGR